MKIAYAFTLKVELSHVILSPERLDTVEVSRDTVAVVYRFLQNKHPWVVQRNNRVLYTAHTLEKKHLMKE